MKINLLKLSLTLTAAAGLASCGGNGGQPLTTTSIPIALATMQTNVFGKLPTSNTVPTLPIAGATTNSGARIKAADCETSTPVTTTDADNDSIALTKKSTFNCSSQTFGTYTHTRIGSYTITDKDDTVAGMMGGIHADFAMTKYNYTDNTTGSEYENSYSGSWDYVGNSTTGALTSTSLFEGSNYYKSLTYSFAMDYDYTYSWNYSMTPTVPASPWTAGAVSFSGAFSMSGTFDREDHSGTHEPLVGTFAIKYRSSDLKYDTTCAKYYTSGSIFMDDYNGSVLEIRYACATAALYVNGVASTLWTP